MRDVSKRPRAGNPSGTATIYRGIYFHSRLEAHWASFFDHIKWPWRYRPLDLPGWTPDFVIAGDLREGGIPVKVVPVDLTGLEERERRIALDPFRARLERAQTIEGFLLLGACPFEQYSGVPITSIGLYFSPWHGRQGAAQYLSAHTRNDNQLDFVPWGPPYRGAITNWSYNYRGGYTDPFISWDDEVLPIWCTAGRALPPLQRGV